MRRLLTCGAMLGVIAVVALSLNASRQTEADETKGPMIIHDVYFSLKDNSPKAKDKLVAACKKYLTDHPGTLFFAAGTLAEDFKRDVNDRDFDVALHIVFQDRKAHDKYQEAERHQKFIDENKDNWKKVRVFDSVANK
jgi:hypothetical protein